MPDDKKEFQEQQKKYKAEIENLNKEINVMKSSLKKNPAMADYIRLGIAIQTLKVLGLNIAIADVYQELFGKPNTNYLDYARKEFYKVLAIMEEMLGNEADLPLGEASEKARKVALLTSKQRLSLIKAIKNSLTGMVERYGPATKWKWSFPEMHGRLAVISRNFTDWRKVEQNRDPRDLDFHPTNELARWVKEALIAAAREFKTKYEFSDNKVTDDLKKIIVFFKSVATIHSFFGEKEDLSRVKNLIEATEETLQSVEEDKKKKDNTRSA